MSVYTKYNYVYRNRLLNKSNKGGKKSIPFKKFINKDLHTFVENTTLNPTLVICVEVLEHLESPKNLLHLIKTKMPNSIIIGTVPINMPYIAHLQV